MKKYTFLEHTADIKFQAFGENLEEAFKNSALALKETITNKTKILQKTKKQIEVEGNDNESLLYNFLEEFLYLLEAEDFIPSKIKSIKIKDNKLRSTISGDKASSYKFNNHVKAITYNDMFVKKQKNKYVCQVVLDV